MIRLFAGYDPREAVGYHVFCQSVIERASVPVSITPVCLPGQAGTNAFTLARFLVPKMCGFKGTAIFADGSDMLAMVDIAELAALADDRYAVQVVKRPPYTTRNPTKYIGTSMQAPNRDYERKNWASLMILNCPRWRMYHRGDKPLDSLQFRWWHEREIGDLPPEWNCLADEGDDVAKAKILHWSSGIPGFPYYRDAPGAAEWWAEYHRMRYPMVP